MRAAAVDAVTAVTVVAALTGCPPPPAVDAPHAIGPIRHEHMAAESDVAYEVDTGIWVPTARQQWQRTTWDRDIEVLATDGDRIVDARVTYTSYRTTWTMSGGREQTDKSALEGKTYLVHVGAGTVAISTADGDEVGTRKGEAAQIQTELRGLAAPDAIVAVLRDAPLDLGAKFRIGETVLAQLVGGDKPDEYWGQATVIDHDATHVVLGLELAQRRIDPVDHTHTGNDLTGTLVIDPINKRAVALELAGTIKVVQKATRAGHAVDVDGAGKAKISWSAY
jgi:hypothetical protein